MSFAKLIMTVEEMENRENWLEARKMGIGGSDAAAILGLSKWGTPFSVWLEKTGQVAAKEEVDNEYLYWGNKLEQLVAERFCEETGKKVRRQGLVRSITYPFMLASCDRVLIGENAGLECKTTASYNFESWDGDNVPDNYLIQCLHYLAVTGMDRWYIACLIGGNKFVWKCIERADFEREITELINAEENFWNKYVVGKETPPVDESDKCTEMLKRKFPGNNDTEREAVELEGKFTTVCRDLEELKASRAALDKQIKKRENEIRLQMENNVLGYAGEFKISYKLSESESIKADQQRQLAKDYPNIYQQYATTSSTRRLVISKKK